MVTKREPILDYSLLMGDWSRVLDQPLLNTPYMNAMIDFLERNYGNTDKTIYPKQSDIFRAFRLTPYKDLRVVIVGQDPYFDGRATGLAFANDDDSALIANQLSPSLEKIKECVEVMVHKGLNLNFDPTLTNWAKQGVLLLNSSLTVQAGAPGSHSKYWNRFMREFLTTLSANRTGICYLFIGGQAKCLAQHVSHKTNHVFSFVHPAWSSRRGESWKCPYFNVINSILTRQNGEEYAIKW
jgi:uracil-DNA glycosylase